MRVEHAAQYPLGREGFTLGIDSNVLRKYWRLILFAVVVIVALCLLFAWWNALFPFVLGLGLAYLLLPLLSWAEKKIVHSDKWRQAKRTFLIILFLVILFGLIGFFFYYLATTVIAAVSGLLYNAPYYISRSLLVLEEWLESFRHTFPPELQQQVGKFVMDAGVTIGNAIKDAFLKRVLSIPNTFGLALSFVVLPVFLFFLLKDSEKLSKGFYSVLPQWTTEHVKNIVAIIGGVLGRYIRAQLVLSCIVAYLCFVGLFALRVQFAATLAIIAGIAEFIPILGPWIAGATAVTIALATAPGKAIWVAILFLAVQLLENNLLVPRIQGSYLRIHPAIALVLLVLGAYVAGFWGIVLAVPLAATSVEIYKYIRHSMKLGEAQ